MIIEVKGFASDRRVFLNGKELTPERSQAIRNHSPDGFMWGYNGSGPAQLALALCLELFPEDVAVQLYQDFKRDVIATLNTDRNFCLVMNVMDCSYSLN